MYIYFGKLNEKLGKKLNEEVTWDTLGNQTQKTHKSCRGCVISGRH